MLVLKNNFFKSFKHYTALHNIMNNWDVVSMDQKHLLVNNDACFNIWQ